MVGGGGGGGTKSLRGNTPGINPVLNINWLQNTEYVDTDCCSPANACHSLVSSYPCPDLYWTQLQTLCIELADDQQGL